MRTRLLHPLIAVLLSACSTPVQEIETNGLDPAASQPARTGTARAGSVPSDRMARAYSSAIAEYLKATAMNTRTAPDTVFIGRQVEISPLVWTTLGTDAAPVWLHDTSFMHMALPATIHDTDVRFVEPDEAEQRKGRRDLVLLNMFARFAGDTAEFTIVTFAQDFRPQHDCSMALIYDAEREQFVLDSLGFAYPYPASGRRKG